MHYRRHVAKAASIMTDTHNKTLHTDKLSAESRTYFFDVKESGDGTRYLCITETRSIGAEHERHRVMVFQEHIESFHEAYLKAAEQFKLKPKAFRVDDVREHFANAYKKWTAEEDDALRIRFTQGAEIKDLAVSFQRQKSAIRSRLSKLGLIPLHPENNKAT